MNTQEQVVEALSFKLMKYGKVVDAVKDMRERGIAGRGRTLEDREGTAQTIEIKHSFWVALLDALEDLS